MSGPAAGAAEGGGQPTREQRLGRAVHAQGGRCLWCGRAFTALVPPTTDHVVPRVKGGPSWGANEVAACRRCNAQRGHLAPADWYLECQRRGWEPAGGALLGALTALEGEIAARGGQRRARPYLQAQLRRLAALPGVGPGAGAGGDPRAAGGRRRAR